MKSVEDEESKRIAVEINVVERGAALNRCAELGFTLKNTPGVDEIKPRAQGMKGAEVDFDAIEIGEKPTDVKAKSKSKRVDLAAISNNTELHIIPDKVEDTGDPGEFIKLDVGDGQDYEALNYNHKLRRKLRRAIESAEIRKEMLVRETAKEYCQKHGLGIPSELESPAKPLNVRGKRVLDDGSLENAKQERVRMRLELAEYNKVARVLRKQAKELAMEAGLRLHAELLGRLPPRGTSGNEAAHDYGKAWSVHFDSIAKTEVDPPQIELLTN